MTLPGHVHPTSNDTFLQYLRVLASLRRPWAMWDLLASMVFVSL
jgi:hypothetical protein